MRHVGRVFLAFAVLWLTVSSAVAEQRIALVIGNSSYANSRLANPVNDARLISRALRQHGFEVIERLDAGERDMGRAVKAFGERLEAAGSDAVGLFYYAGHGVQVGGINYLIPVDADIEDEEDVPIEAVSADHILGIIEAAGNRLNLMFLDACRNNPFLRTSRNARHGLAMMNAPAGIFIGYATAPGDVAKDGSGTNSPFTTAMAATMGQPGEPIESMFKRVRLSVIAATEGEQTPWSASSLTGDFSFVPGAAVVTPVPPIVPDDQPTRDMVRQAQEMLAALGYDPGPIDGDMGRRTTAAVIAFQQSKGIPVDGLVSDVLLQHLLGADGPAPATDASLVMWVLIEDSDRAADFESFLAQYPNSPMARSARDRLAELRRVAVVTPPPEPEPVPPSHRAGETFRDCPACPEMVVVPAGNFQMGSPGGEVGRDDNEGPLHLVSVEQAFAVGKYEITRGEYAAFIRATGRGAGDGCYVNMGGVWGKKASWNWQDPSFSQSNREPVVCVNWSDAKVYSDWLTRQTGFSYRLLNEAEWEYVARAGTQAARYWSGSLDQVCRYANAADLSVNQIYENWVVADCEDGATHTATRGQYIANGFGLYDMLGNVWEWTEDCYHSSYSGAPSRAIAWAGSTGCSRVLRGGSWVNNPRDIRAANRSGDDASVRYNVIGFRVARTLF